MCALKLGHRGFNGKGRRRAVQPIGHAAGFVGAQMALLEGRERWEQNRRAAMDRKIDQPVIGIRRATKGGKAGGFSIVFGVRHYNPQLWRCVAKE